LREQVITPRATGRTGAASSKASAGGIVQKPARRERGAGAKSRTDASLSRRVLRYFPLVGKILLAVVTGLLIFAGYRAAANASFFQARSIEVNSTSRANAKEIKALVQRAVAETGVWRADLEEISADLQRVPWVRSAVVSRVLPDGLRVRVTERVQRAVLRTTGGRLVWVDEDAVLLGPIQPADTMPPFFIRGLDETATSAANRERMQKYEELRRDWEQAGLSERVSEVNLDDLRDVRAQLAGDDAQVEVRLGGESFGYRLKRAIEELDARRTTPLGPFIMYIDAAQLNAKDGKGHLIVGSSPNAPATATEQTSTAAGSVDAEIVEAKASERSAASRDDRSRRAKESARNKEESARSKEEAERRRKERDKREKRTDKAKADTRPRRVG
jgi:cell division septal protein FtsQ